MRRGLSSERVASLTRAGCFALVVNKYGGLHRSRQMSWETKEGVQKANYFGSLTQASTCRIGAFNNEEVHVPFKSVLPMASICHAALDVPNLLGGLGLLAVSAWQCM